MNIMSNIAALNASNNLRITNSSRSKAMEKLSSGLRINRAADDAAGLAISEKMRGQIRGLNQASRNIQDGISLIQTAEGAMQEIHAMLQRMNELAVQSANGTYNNSDRENIQFEFKELQNQIDNIADGSHFNGIKLLSGAPLVSGAPLNNVNAISVDSPPNNKKVTVFSGVGKNVKETLENIIDAFNKAKAGSIGDNDTQRVTSKFELSYVDDLLLVKCITTDGFLLGGGSPNLFFQRSIGASYAYKFTEYINENDFIQISDIGGTNGGDTLKFNFTPVEITQGTQGSQGSIAIQIGANAGETLTLDMPNVTTTAIGISELDISTISGASNALDPLQNAINKVSSERSKMGAYQNRLEHNNNLNYAENLMAAESRIRDADIAKEMMLLTKTQILMEAGQAMLTQANANRQGVLSLLK